MSQASNYLENALQNHFLAVSTFTRPTTVFLALYTTNPTDADTGTEVSGSGYSRQTITFGSASGGSSTNTNTVTFTASGGNFGTITHWGIRDASTGGNLLVYGALTASRTVTDGESLVFNPSTITVTTA